MFFLFYLSVGFYPNKLNTYMTDPTSDGYIIYPLIYFLLHGVSIYLFLITGSNPGFVSETDTPLSRKAKAAALFTGHYDEFRDVAAQDEVHNTTASGDSESAASGPSYAKVGRNEETRDEVVVEKRETKDGVLRIS